MLLFGSMWTVIKTDGEEQEKAMKEVSEKLQLLEKGPKELFPDGSYSIDATMWDSLTLFSSQCSAPTKLKKFLG